MAGYVNGSNAVSIGGYGAPQQPVARPKGNLSVVRGMPESQPRHMATPVSPLTTTAIKCAIAFGVVLLAVAFARILLISLAFGVSYENAALNASLDEQRALGSQLEVQESMYGRSDRIIELATGVYGMVPAQGTAYMDLGVA